MAKKKKQEIIEQEVTEQEVTEQEITEQEIIVDETITEEVSTESTETVLEQETETENIVEEKPVILNRLEQKNINRQNTISELLKNDYIIYYKNKIIGRTGSTIQVLNDAISINGVLYHMSQIKIEINQ